MYEKKLSIDEIEELLNGEEEQAFEILPSGEVRALDGKTIKKKPLVIRENLGGEYGC